MVAFVRQTLMRALPLYGAVVGGVITAVTFLLLSTDSLETLVWTTGVAALVPAAAPPLGSTARVLLALGGGLLVAAVLWSSLFLLFGPGGLLAKRAPREDGVPVIRRADAHPDAQPRKPMSAADLGTPMMEVGVGTGPRDERAIPVDLDLPLAAFDPKAILPVPMEPVRPVSPLVPVAIVAPVIETPRTAEPETFVTAPFPQPIKPATDGVREPTPDAKPTAEVAAPTPIARPPHASTEPTNPPTIETLLQRLEQGALRRGRIGTH